MQEIGNFVYNLGYVVFLLMVIAMMCVVICMCYCGCRYFLT